jgi:hypothetical protein
VEWSVGDFSGLLFCYRDLVRDDIYGVEWMGPDGMIDVVHLLFTRVALSTFNIWEKNWV